MKSQLLKEISRLLKSASPEKRNEVRGLLMRKLKVSVHDPKSGEDKTKRVIEGRKDTLLRSAVKMMVQQSKDLNENQKESIRQYRDVIDILEKIEEKEAPTKLEAEIVSEPKWWKRNVDVKVQVKQEGTALVVGAIFTLGEKLIEFLSKWRTLPFLVKKVEEDFNTPQKVAIIDPRTGLTLSKEDIQGDVLVNLQSASGPDKIRIFDSKRRIIDPSIDTTLAVQVAEDSGDPNLLYVGEADPGTLTSVEEWRIKLIDSTSGVIITWAGGDTEFDQEWDERESLTYT